MYVLALILAGAMATAAPHAHTMMTTRHAHGNMKTKTTMHGKMTTHGKAMHNRMHGAMHGSMQAHHPMPKPTKKP